MLQERAPPGVGSDPHKGKGAPGEADPLKRYPSNETASARFNELSSLASKAWVQLLESPLKRYPSNAMGSVIAQVRS